MTTTTATTTEGGNMSTTTTTEGGTMSAQPEQWISLAEEALAEELARKVRYLEAGWDDFGEILPECAMSEPCVYRRCYGHDGPELVAWTWDPRDQAEDGWHETLEAVRLVTAEDRARWAAAREAWLNR